MALGTLTSKVFEVRDRNTFLPVVATLLHLPEYSSDRHWQRSSRLLWRAGFSPNGPALVMLCKLTSAMAKWDPHDWGDRTMAVAHQYIAEHWSELEPGALIDVEFVLGETTEPKRSELDDAY